MKTHRLLLLCAFAGGLAAATPDVLTYHNDNARTGQQLNETILTPANVNSSTFGRLFVISVDGKVDAEPLYVAGISIAGGTHNVLVVATEHDSVYAFDADSGATLWHVSMLSSGETPSDDRGCSQVTPEIGVTSTPVIDLGAGSHGTVYVVAMSKNGAGQYLQRLHALDLTTGAEQFGGPVAVQATYPGTGDNSSGGNVVFDPGQYKDRAGLLLLNGVVYTSWASHCDIRPYTAWMIGYNENTLAQTTVLNVTPNGNEGSFWSAGAGPAADANGNIFALVANGTFDTTLNASGFPNRADFGNTFLHISTSGGHLAVADYFAMFNVVAENNTDLDLGSGGALVVPDMTDSMGRTRHLAVGAGKDSHIYVADRDNMGKFNPANNGSIYQDIVGALSGQVFSMPAYFGGVIYYGAVGDTLKAFPFSSALLASSASSQSATTFQYPGAMPSISANGSGNGIVWAAENGAAATLHAYDAANLTNELYNSNQAPGGRDQFGTGNKFITPMIANGKVYVGTISGVGVFGLLGAGAPGSFALLSPANKAGGVAVSASVSWGSSSGATSYDVYFGTSSPPPLASNVTSLSYTPGTLSANTLYYWQVVARNASGSTASAIWSFSTQGSVPAAPVLVSPANGATGVSLTPTVNWNAAAGATSYDVHFGTVSPPPLATNITGTSYTPGTLSAGTVYYWQVVAKNGSGSTASAIWSFTTQGSAPPAPVLISPANGVAGVSLTPTVNWSAATGATSYDVHFGTVSPPPLATNITGTGYAPGTLSAGTVYYWQVVAKNSGGSTASAIWSFTTQVAAPVLVSPANGATGISAAPTLSWNGSTGATSYDVYFGTASPPPLVTNTAGTSYAPGTLSGGTVYYWQVAARNSGGSTTSAIWVFTTQVSGPQAPALIAPVNGAAGVTLAPTLSWNAAAGATSYDVYFGAAFPPPLVTNTAGTSYAPGTLSGGTVYYWQVGARNSGGSSKSAIWMFTTQIGPPAAPALTAPSNGAVNVPATTVLEWSASAGAVSYDVYLGTSLPLPLVTNTSGTSYTPPPLSAGTVYSWQVSARNSGGASPSATWQFTTGIAAPVLAAPANGAINVLLTPVLSWSASSGATSYDVYFGTAASPPLVTNTTGNSYAPGTLATGALYFWRVTARNANGSSASGTWSFTTPYATPALAASQWVPVTPCRVADTRGATGPFAGPSLAGGSSRTFAIPQSACGIPPTATAYSLNVTVVPSGPLSYLTLWPAGETQPLVSTLNSFDGSVVANAAIVPAGAGGAVSVYASNPTDVIVDIDGYFETAGTPNALAFYPATPCRVADTRGAAGTFGGPSMGADQTRDFPIPLSSCAIPSTAGAYALNVTVVPDPVVEYLGYLSTWPAGQARPFVSTLNSWAGKVVANAALVPAGNSGSISVFVTNQTDVILDVNGYFAAPGAAGALSFYPVAPCRVADTRNAAGPAMQAGETRAFAVSAGGCAVPAAAAAYSLNVTAVPEGPLQYLTAWPAGSARPLVSTLNSFDGRVVANAAIVPAGASGAIDIFVTDATHLVLDIDGYFAP